MPLVYPRLRAIAGSLDRRESKTPTLQATALVHEAYLRLLNQHSLGWENREHFFWFAAQVMPFILTDHARAHLASKRGGSSTRVPLHEDVQWIPLGGPPQPQLPVLEHYQTPALEGHPDVFDSAVQNQFRADLAAQITPWISEPRVLG